MRYLIFSIFLSIIPSAGAADTGQCVDYETLIIMERLDLLPSSNGLGSRSELLWSATGNDNASCIRSVADVNGDGVCDAVVGHDIFQDGHNLFCYSGASTGSGSVIWSLETSGGASGGYFWGDECLSIGSDTDGNGYPNILAGLAGGGRFAASYDGYDGSLLWQFDTYNEPESGWIYSIRELGDVNDDGIADIIFGCGSTNDHAYCIDGASTGTSPVVLWSLDLPDACFSVSPITDVNADGKPDALISSGDADGHHVYCVSGASTGAATVLWPFDAGASVHSVTSCSDANGNGVDDFVAATWGNGVRCGDGFNGQPIWFNLLSGTYCMMVKPLADVTGDGVDEIIVGTWENAVYVLNGTTGSIVWETPTGTLNGGDVWTVSSVSDLNGDGYDDVLAGSFDTYMYCLSGIDGDVLFSHLTGNRVYSVNLAGDLNGDGIGDVLAGTQDTTSTTVVYAVSGADQLPPTPSPSPTQSCIHDGDVNMDGELSAGDAQAAFFIVLGLLSPSYEEACAADCNGDGEVTAGDAQAIFLALLQGGSCVDPIQE
ncbi:VCBS repeat-containing protein [bacterium]|nr:VCBS repeat-containing protein [candidate division CSSED10-310 bacterium]